MVRVGDLGGMRMWRTLAFGLALIAISSQMKQLHAETCPEQVSREIAEMRKQQAELRSGPYENGPIQELGQCTRQAVQLGLAFAARGPASEQQAAKEEAANCLQLRIKSARHQLILPPARRRHRARSRHEGPGRADA